MEHNYSPKWKKRGDRTGLIRNALLKSMGYTDQDIEKPIKIAVMGCVVNGVGEGKDADVGIAGGKDKCVIFRDGEVVKTVMPQNAEEELLKEVEEWLKKN